MKRAKKMLAFVLAGVMLMSNVAYAAPTTDADGTDAEVAVDTLSLDPKEETGGETPSDDASDTNTAAETTEQAPVESTPADTETQPSDSALTDGTEPAPAGGTEVTMPSEDGQETLPDENNATEDEVTGAADSAQAYDITFESKEQHGQVLTMDDQEVKEGEILKTDENGMAQFKVKANDGYEVEKVVNKADNIPLTLIENSYYEIQVDGSTVIEIHYKKIPANEDADEADDNGDDAKTEEGSVTGAIRANTRIAANQLNLDPQAVTEVAVSIVDENDNPIAGAPASVSTGVCSEQAPAIEGYDFLNATVDGDEIYAIGSFGDTIYYVPMEDQDTGLLLQGKTIVFHYELHVETYSITYTAGSGMEYNGPESVKHGESYSFTVTPTKAEDTGLNVYVNGVDISSSGVLSDAATGMMRYTVNDVQEAQNIVIGEYQISTYTFTYNNDNING